MERKYANRIPLIMLIVGFSLIFIFRGIPLLSVIVRSFMTNTLSGEDSFTGLANFREVFSDQVFWQSLGNSMLLLLYIPILIVISLIIALIIFEGFPLSGLYKTIIVFPQIVSTMTVASIFSCLFGLNGPINALISFFKLEAVYWLGEKTTAISVIIACIVYSMFGWQTLIFSGSLSTIDPNIQALIQIDGVGFGHKMRIYAYEMRRTVFFSVVINLIYGFAGYFPIIHTLTKGGPGYYTTTIDYLIYLRAFRYGRDLSSAYACAALLFAFVMLLVVVLYVLLERRDGSETA